MDGVPLAEVTLIITCTRVFEYVRCEDVGLLYTLVARRFRNGCENVCLYVR
jgi:hypothetical protein